MAEYEVEWVEVAGQRVLASELVCPVCHVLDLDVTVNMASSPWRATDSNGHSWDVYDLRCPKCGEVHAGHCPRDLFA